MRKQAVLAGPSLVVGLALSTFAASYIEEERRRKKKKSKRKLSEGIRPIVGAGEGGDIAGCSSPGFSTSRRVEKRKNPPSGDEGDSSTERPDKQNWTDKLSLPLSLDQNGRPDSADPLPECLRWYGDADEWSIPSDTVVALKMMCAQFPKIDKTSVRPFVLRSQLYSSVSDRTSADRDLEGLKQRQVVRIFKLSSGQDDFAIMFLEDYLSQITEEKKRMGAKYSHEEIAVFDWFSSNVLPIHTGVSIRHSELLLKLSEVGHVNEKHISLLINAGLLVRQLTDETSCWFSIPRIGSLLKNLSQGRKELLSFLGRRRYKEMIQAVLEKRKLKTSQLDMRFHIRDLLGSGELYSIHTPVGPLLRLAQD